MIGFQLGIIQGCSADVWQLLVFSVSPLQTPGSGSVCLSSVASPGAVRESVLFIAFWKLSSGRKAGEFDGSTHLIVLCQRSQWWLPVAQCILCVTVSEANPTGFHFARYNRVIQLLLRGQQHIFTTFLKRPNNLDIHLEIFKINNFKKCTNWFM